MPAEKRYRDIDKDINRSYKKISRLHLVSRFFMRRWKILLVAVFVVGFLTAVIWMISEDYFPW